MKKLENKCMLITYSDSMGKNLNELGELLEAYFKKAVGGVHILPFFPSSGDRGLPRWTITGSSRYSEASFFCKKSL